MRIVFVWPVVRMSIWDVAVGHRKALGRILGEENIKDYHLDKRTALFNKMFEEVLGRDEAMAGKMATEAVLPEALYHNADAVLIFSGLNFHPAGLWLLERCRIPTAVYFTESPYEDDEQFEWGSTSSSLQAMTNDLYSAEKFGWNYLPHAYNPEVHFPGGVNPVLPQHDVVFIGSGWPERQQFIEKVDWTGINLGLYGMWPGIKGDHPLTKFYTHGNVRNEDTAQLYRNSKICLNFHRGSPTARSMGPRCVEIAACGAFQLSDPREELLHVFGESVPTFETPEDLSEAIRYFLSNDIGRHKLAKESLARVASHTFDARTPLVLDTLQRAMQSLKERV